MGSVSSDTEVPWGSVSLMGLGSWEVAGHTDLSGKTEVRAASAARGHPCSMMAAAEGRGKVKENTGGTRPLRSAVGGSLVTLAISESVG